jgi:hypothetical protein
MAEVYESGNRRAVIDGKVVSFLRVTGNVRRSVQAVWWTECADVQKARRLAKRWAFRGKLGKLAVNAT